MANGLLTSKEYQEQLDELSKQISSLETEIRVKKELLASGEAIGEELKELTQTEVKIAEYALEGAKKKQQEVTYLLEAAKKQEAGIDPGVKPPTEGGETVDPGGGGEGTTKPEKPIDPETGGQEGEDCNCPDKDDNDGITNERQPDHIIPPLGMRGVFTYKPPFDKPEYKDLEVTVKALRLIKEVIDSEDDPWTNIYQLNKLTEDDYDRDVRWKIPIIVFATDVNNYFYVPATYLGSLPKPLTGMKYQQIILGVDLGYLPVDYNLDLAKNTIKDNLAAVTGISSRVETIQASAIEVITQEEHEKFQKALKERLTDTNSPAVKLKLLQEKFVQLQEQLKVYNNCFHFHVEKQLQLLDKERLEQLGYGEKEETPDPDKPEKPEDTSKYKRTEEEYQKLLGDYYSAKFGYDSFLARYQDLKNRYDQLDLKRKELEETIVEKDEQRKAIEKARDDEYRKRDRYYAAKHPFEQHWYIQAPDSTRLYGAIQINCQKKKTLIANNKEDVYGFVLGEYPVLCKDCIKHTYEYIDYVNKATLEAIPSGLTSINIEINNSNRVKDKDGKKVPDPLPIKIEKGWDYGITRIDNDQPTIDDPTYIQPGQTGELNFLWFGTTRKEKKQYCKHIPAKFHGQDIKFDPYAVAVKPVNVSATARELEIWNFELKKDFVMPTEINTDMKRIFDKIDAVLKGEIGKTPIKLTKNEYILTLKKEITVPKKNIEIDDPNWTPPTAQQGQTPPQAPKITVQVPESTVTYDEVVNYSLWDQSYAGTGVAPTGDGDKVNTVARTMIAGLRLNSWMRTNLETLASCAADYYNEDKPTWLNVCKYIQQMLTYSINTYNNQYKNKGINLGLNTAEYYPAQKPWPTAYQNENGYDAQKYSQTTALWNLSFLNLIYFPIGNGSSQDLNAYVDKLIQSQASSGWEVPTT